MLTPVTVRVPRGDQQLELLGDVLSRIVEGRVDAAASYCGETEVSLTAVRHLDAVVHIRDFTGVDDHDGSTLLVQLFDIDSHMSPLELAVEVARVRCLSSCEHPMLARWRVGGAFQTTEANAPEYALLVTSLNVTSNLRSRISELAMCKHHLPVVDVWIIFLQIALAVGDMHAVGVHHGVIETRNIFVESDLRVTLGPMAFREVYRRGERIIGSNSFYSKSPEVLMGSPSDAAQVDAWALGVVLFQLLALAPPFGAGPVIAQVHRMLEARISPLPADTDPQLAALVPSLLQPKPQERLTVEELLRQPCVDEFLALDRPGLTESQLARIREIRLQLHRQRQQHRDPAPSFLSADVEVELLLTGSWVPRRMRLAAGAVFLSYRYNGCDVEESELIMLADVAAVFPLAPASEARTPSSYGFVCLLLRVRSDAAHHVYLRMRSKSDACDCVAAVRAASALTGSTNLHGVQ